MVPKVATGLIILGLESPAAGVHVVSVVCNNPGDTTMGFSVTCESLHTSIVSGRLAIVTH